MERDRINVRAGYVEAGINVRVRYVGAGFGVRAGYVGAGFDSDPDAVQASRRNPPLQSLPVPSTHPSSTHHGHLMGLIHCHPGQAMLKAAEDFPGNGAEVVCPVVGGDAIAPILPQQRDDFSGL